MSSFANDDDDDDGSSSTLIDVTPSNYEDLFAGFVNILRHHGECYSCGTHVADSRGQVSFRAESEFPWFVQFTCGSCIKLIRWGFCSQCDESHQFRKPVRCFTGCGIQDSYTQRRRLKNHHDKFHQLLPSQPIDVNDDDGGDVFAGFDGSESSPSAASPSQLVNADNWLSVIKENNSSPTPYESMINDPQAFSKVMGVPIARFVGKSRGDIERGYSYLVARALSQVDDTDMIRYHDHDRDQLMKLALLVSVLPSSHLDLLSSFIEGLVDQPADIDPAYHTRPNFTNVISNSRNVLLDGKWAFCSNLAIPQSIDLKGNTYFSLYHILSHTLGLGYDIEPLVPVEESPDGSVSSIRQSKRARQLVEKAESNSVLQNRIILPIFVWADDASPFVIMNLGSMHVAAVTVAPVHARLQTDDNVFLLSLSDKHTDHQPMWDRFYQELSELSNPSNEHWFYYHKMGCMCQVVVELLAVLQDCPERRTHLRLTSATAIVACRWMYIFHSKQCWKTLISCPHCFQRRLDRIAGDCRTGVCTDWSMDGPEAERLLKYKVNKNYPSSQLPDPNQRYLSVRQQNLQLLRAAAEIAIEMYRKGNWNKTETKDFLHDCSFLGAEVDCLLKCVEDGVPDQYKIPTQWDAGIDIFIFLDVIMHLLFLGVVKTVMKDFVRRWLRMQFMHAGFCRGFGSLLEKAKCFHRPWLKVKNYTDGKLGGWVSDQYLAQVRLFKWFYSCMDDVESQQYKEPPAGHRWLKPDYKAWLAAHGQSTTGLVDELRDRTNKLKEQTGGPPPLVERRGGPVGCVFDVIESTNCFVSHVMVEEVNPMVLEEMDRQIKLFLSLCAKLDEKLRLPTEDVFFIGKNNFLSLLNLPETSRVFGPMRLYWEGSGRGEGFLKRLKPLVKNMIRDGWANKAGENFYVLKTLRHYFRHLKKDQGGNSMDDCYKWETEEALNKAKNDGDLMAGAVFENDYTKKETIVMFTTKKRGGKEYEVHRVDIVGDAVTRRVGADYFKIESMTKLTQEEWTAMIESSSLKRECIFLPLLHKSGSFAHTVPNSGFQTPSYYIVGSDWTEYINLTDGGRFSRPVFTNSNSIEEEE